MLSVFRRKDLCEAKHDAGFENCVQKFCVKKSISVSDGLAIWGGGAVNGLKVKWGTSSDI